MRHVFPLVLAFLGIVGTVCSAHGGAPASNLQLSLWERGVAFQAPGEKDMKVYLWFYEWNMFGAREPGQHTGGTYRLPQKINKEGTRAEIGGEGLRLAVTAGEGSAELELAVTNGSKHDWPELAGIIPCFNPGPKKIRNRQFANSNTYFHGRKGLERLVKREIHFNRRLRPAVDRQAADGKFVFSFKWPTSSADAESGVLIRESTNGRWVTGVAWEDFLSAQGHNPWECMHLCVRVGPLKRGEKKAIRGKVYLFEGKKEDCFERYAKDFKLKNATKGGPTRPSPSE